MRGSTMRFGDWDAKCWGLTRILFANKHHSLHELMLVEGFQCSRHRHAQRANSFYLDSGELEICTYESDGTPISEFNLRAGGTIEIPSQIWHRFKVLKSGRCFETYWPDRGGIVRLDDIERADEGGPI